MRQQRLDVSGKYLFFFFVVGIDFGSIVEAFNNKNVGMYYAHGSKEAK